MSAILDYLRTSPVCWIFVTLLAYRAGVWLRERTGGHPLAQPVVVAAALVIAVLLLLDVDYEAYMSGGSMIHLVLGPATVALAVPLYRQAHHLKEMLLPMLVALPIGAVVSIGSAVLTLATFATQAQFLILPRAGRNGDFQRSITGAILQIEVDGGATARIRQRDRDAGFVIAALYRHGGAACSPAPLAHGGEQIGEVDVFKGLSTCGKILLPLRRWRKLGPGLRMP